MEVATARPGYELWRPNREKSASQGARVAVIFVLLLSALLALIIIFGGWSKLEGGKNFALAYVVIYLLLAWRVFKWSRGVLPVAAALAMILAIFSVLAAPSWLERAKDGLSSPALPEEILGLLTIAMIPLQIVLVALSIVAFNQDWHVEEERPIGKQVPA